MKGIILAAGRGSRMLSLTNDKPKCLNELNGKPLLEWQLEALKKGGVSDFAIVTGYKSEKFLNYDATKFHNKNWEKTNMVKSLECADKWLSRFECIISYSDIFYESTAIELLINSTASMAITYDPNWLELWKKRFNFPLMDAETFTIDESSFLTEIGNKPDINSIIMGQYMGLLKISPFVWKLMKSALKQIPKQEHDILQMTHFLQKLIINDNFKINAIPYHGKWWEFDSENDFIKFEN
jgi:choline kinase